MKGLLFMAVMVVAANSSWATSPTRTPMDKIQIRLRQQNIQIARDVKAGKLTKDQAKTLKSQVEAIRKAEIADLKQNGTKNLTDDQVNQLNQQLNTLSKSIPIR